MPCGRETDCGRNRPRLRVRPIVVSGRLSAQKVRDSDGSVKAGLSLMFGRIGFYGGVDRYFEHIEAKGTMGLMSEDVRIHLGEATFAFRFIDKPNLFVDFHMGAGIAASTHFETLTGPVFGIRARGELNDMLALTAEGRLFHLEDDIKVNDGAIGLQISQAWLGYRAMKFSVGPVLEGPEIGLRMNF